MTELDTLPEMPHHDDPPDVWLVWANSWPALQACLAGRGQHGCIRTHHQMHLPAAAVPIAVWGLMGQDDYREPPSAQLDHAFMRRRKT